jgi:biopolymer transport protein ExbB
MSILNMILAQAEPVNQAVQQAADTVQQTMDSTVQVMTDSAAAIAAATAPAAAAAEPVIKELSIWDLITAGGWWFMIPLALLAVVSIYIFFERLFAINHANRQDRSFMDRIKEYIHRGEVDQALKLCQDTNTPYFRMIEKGVTRIGRPMNDVLVAIENVGNMEVAKLEKGFNWLATTAAGAPMIGFLGTVVGMVNAFFQLASAGNNSNVSILAGGIYQALVTTVAGLIVGIIALFAYNYLTSRVNKVMNKLEGKTMEFMDLLNEPAK